MTSEPESSPATGIDLPSYQGRGWRVGQLLALMGLTGFAVSQPLLAVAGEDPTLFTFAGVSGWGLVVFALVVALVPPLVLWGLVLLAGLVDRRAGDVVFLVGSALLAGATVIQWAKTVAGLDQALVLGVIGLVGTVGFAVALVRVPTVALWTRFTAVLPPLAVILLLVASPAGDLLRSRAEAPDRSGSAGVDGEGAEPPSVVFIMLDELPLESVLADDGTFDEIRFPNLAALAGDSTWYRDYTVQANGTLQSVPSILSGQIPSGGRPIWTDQPDNLFSLLAPTHDLDVSESVTQLCGFSNCDIEGAQHGDGRGIRSVLSQMVDVWRDRVSLGPIPELDLDQFAAAVEPLDPDQDLRSFDGGPADRNVAAPGVVVDFIGAFERSTTPSLSYLHLLLPHQPWMRYPDGRVFDGWSQLELGMSDIEVDEWILAQLNQAHLFQTMYADHLLGELVDALKAEGIYDDALVVVTADHGVGFSEQNRGRLRLVSPETMSSIAYVPLLIKSPGQDEGRVDDSNLMGVDLLPTLAAELGIELPWEVDGFPAGSREVADRGTQKVFYDFGDDFGREVVQVVEFETDDHRPVASNRPVGAVEADEHSLAALARTIDAAEWLGERVEDMDLASGGGDASLPRAEALLRRSTRAPGRLDGMADPSSSGTVVLLVFDGVVQSVAPVHDDGRFTMMLPPEVEPHRTAEVQLLQVDGDEVTEVAL